MDTIANEQAFTPPFASSPLLPLLLMSLATQKHTPETSQDFKSEYDYVIVGAGAAGSVVANRLSELPCVSVLLLEAGKAPPRLTEVPAIARYFIDTDIDWKYRTVPQLLSGFGLVNNQVVWPSGKVLGGSTILNAMLHVRGNKKNYDDWAAQGATGWSYEDVLPYFKKLEDNRDLEYVQNGFHGTGGPTTVQKPPYNPELKLAIFEAAKELGYSQVDSNGPLQNGFFDHQGNIRNGQRCSAAKSYLVPAENRTNLNILPEAFVKKIVIKGDRATGVLFDYKGKQREVRAKKEVILSAGTINSAQLLMLSGVGPSSELAKHNIPLIANLPVGLNLQDHCIGLALYELSNNISSFTKKLKNNDNIQTYIDNRTGPLTSTEGVVTMAFLKNQRLLPLPTELPEIVAISSATPEIIPKNSTSSESIPENSASSESIPKDITSYESIPKKNTSSESIPNNSTTPGIIPESSATPDIPKNSVSPGIIPNPSDIPEITPETIDLSKIIPDLSSLPEIIEEPGDLPDHQLYFLEGIPEITLQAGLKPEIYEQYVAPYENKPNYWCVSSILHPRSRGSVTLNSADPYDPPLINPNYYQNPLDLRDVVEGMKTCQTISRSAAMKKIGVKPFASPLLCTPFALIEDLYLACIALSVPVTLSHQVGTAKMGRVSDPTTVVDPELRVKQIKALRVVDASIMPLVPSGNTNVPTLMIAEKASDMIKESIKCT